MKTQKDIIIDVIRGNPSQLSSYMKIKNYLNELRYVLCDAVHEKNLIIKQEAIFCNRGFKSKIINLFFYAMNKLSL